jgi:hypothetical protein
LAYQIITLLIAIYGATLSTTTAILNFRKDRRSLEVRMSTMMYTYGSELGPPMLAIEIINIGHRQLVVDPPQLMVTADPNRVLALMGADGLADFPKRLNDGESGSVRTPYKDVAAGLLQAGHRGTVELIAICKDSTGRRYRSKPWSVDLLEWLRME